MFSLPGAGIMYCWGLWHTFAWDIEEACSLKHGQPWEPEKAESSCFPLRRQCNEVFDLVPGYVNPMIIVCMAGVVLGAVSAIRAARQSPEKKPQEETFS